MSFASIYWHLLRKDIRVELCSYEGSVALIAQGILFSVVFGLCIQSAMIPQDKLQQLFPVVLWVAFLLTGCSYVEKSCATDTQDRALDALLLMGIAPWVIFISKVTAVSLVVLASVASTAACCAVLLNVSVWSALLGLLVIAVLVSIGYAAVSILLASVASNSRLKGGLLPLIVIPMLFPLLIGAVETTQDLLIGRLSWDSPWIALLVACDVVYFVAGINLYEHAIRS